MNKIIILLANGFEEIEALAPLDVLRRLDYDVKLISMNATKEVVSSHKVIFTADELFSNDLVNASGLIIPGGMPGAVNLRDDDRVINLVRKFHQEKKMIAAICAGPIVLGKAEILKDLIVTSYPGFQDELGAKAYVEDKVVLCENVITSRGPATAFDFAFKIAEYLGLDTKNLKKGMLFI